MPKRWKSDRFIITVLLLVSFACVQTAIALDFHHHEDGGPHSHCCPACHAGHLPALQSEKIEFSAPLSTAWHKASDPQVLPHGCFDVSHSSRAPPA